MYDVIVIGAGPAGLAAATYTSRRHLLTLVIAPDLAGKAAYRLQLPWREHPEQMLGEETVEQLRHQIITSHQIERRLDRVEQIFLRGDTFNVITDHDGVFSARTVIVASGVTPRLLGVPGEQRLMGYGVTYSAVSHAHLFAGYRVVVVGHDLRALQATAELVAIAAHVTLIVPDRVGLAGYMLGQRLLHDERVHVLDQHTVREITGERYVTGIVVSAPDGTAHHMPADGVFIEYGVEVPSAMLGALVERSTSGHIVVNEYGATRCPGLFAAGDVTSVPYAEQVLTALGAGACAGLSVCSYLLEGVFTQPEQPDARSIGQRGGA